MLLSPRPRNGHAGLCGSIAGRPWPTNRVWNESAGSQEQISLGERRLHARGYGARVHLAGPISRSKEAAQRCWLGAAADRPRRLLPPMTSGRTAPWLPARGRGP